MYWLSIDRQLFILLGYYEGCFCNYWSTGLGIPALNPAMHLEVGSWNRQQFCYCWRKTHMMSYTVAAQLDRSIGDAGSGSPYTYSPAFPFFIFFFYIVFLSFTPNKPKLWYRKSGSNYRAWQYNEKGTAPDHHPGKQKGKKKQSGHPGQQVTMENWLTGRQHRAWSHIAHSLQMYGGDSR